jgi:predicted ester cyclase
VQSDETRDFANRLMQRVWMRLDSTEVPDFYHRDVIGHHDSPKGSDELGYADVVHRLDWDRGNFTEPDYRIADLIAGDDRFAIRFYYSATLIATGERYSSEAAYFYHLRDGKIAEFWLLANVDFDYKE